MNLQNVDAAVYTKAADAVASGKYKLVYEKAGRLYGSKSGVPGAGDYCFNKQGKAAKAASKQETKNVADAKETTAPTIDVPVAQPVETNAEQNTEVKE
jgi:hypothetical protein